MTGEITSGLDGKQVFVVPISGGYTNEATVDAFLTTSANGEIGVFNADTDALITTPLIEGQQYYIAQKRVVAGKSSITRTISRSATITHKRNAGATSPNAYGYSSNLVVGVNEVYTFTITAPASLEGQTFGLTLFDKSEATEKFPQENYNFVSITGAETPTQIATGIVADYTAQQNRYLLQGRGNPSIYTISNVGAIITITAITNRTHSEIGYSRDFVTTGLPTIANTVAWVSAEGDSTSIKQIEREGEYRDGRYYPVEVMIRDYWGSDISNVVGGCTYDIIQLNTIQNTKQLPVTNAEVPYTVFMAFQSTAIGTSGSAGLTAIKTVLELV